jgi:hypothetical protein
MKIKKINIISLKIKRDAKRFFLTLLILFLVTSCATILKKSESGVKKDFSYSILLLKKHKDLSWFELSSNLINPAVLKGDYTINENGDIECLIKSLYFFTNWTNGWTEGELEAFGQLLFKKNENDKYSCVIIEEVELLDVKSGSIKFFDDYYYEDRARRNIRNKLDRINSINNFLKEKENISYFKSLRNNKDKTEKSYIPLTYQLFFPELTLNSPYSNKNSEYKVVSVKEDTQLEETILWNKIYTKAIFPENLQPVRDSGSLLRDYEESVELFFMDYNINYYINNILPELTFN